MICPACQTEAGVSEVCGACGRPLFLPSGHVLSARYEILSMLGSGGMGTVYRAHDRILDETVALKVLRLDLARSAGMARRFRSEIKLARKVSHRNVCRIYDYGEDGQHVYISMEFVDGEDLLTRVRGRGLPTAEGFEIAVQLTKGLQAVHDVGIIHRDLKSSNVMVDVKGLVRLMDFGIAKRWISDGQVTGTMVGQIMGTPEYMSPEQARGHPVDFRGDIYSLGIVLYEVFTGHVPFEGRTNVETLFMQLEEPPPLAGPKAKKLPRSIVPILRRALAKDPADRYASARGMTEALRLARGGHDVEPRVRPPFFRLPRPAAAPEPSPPAEGREPTSVLEQLLDELEVEAPPALEAASDPGVQQKVEDLARDMQHQDVRRRWRAAVALWEMGPAAAEAEDALTAALSDEAPLVANAAAQALARVRGEAAARHDTRHTTGVIEVPVLIEALRHEDVRVREWAAVALRDLGTAAQEAVPPLLAVLRDPASGIRDWAALALGSVCTDATEVLPELVRALQDPSMFLRAAAAAALGTLGSRARPALPQLMEALRDENGGVRGRAAVALGRMGAVARDAVPALLRLLEDRDVSVADAAALALEKIIGRPEPTAAFAAVDPARRTAVPAAAHEGVAPGPPAAVEAAAVAPAPEVGAADEGTRQVRELSAGLADRDATVRWRAAVALGQMGPGAAPAVRALIEAMGEDRDESVRWEAAKALGKVGPDARDAVPALAAALGEDDDVLRNAAATALGLMGAEAQKAVPALIHSLRGDSEDAPDAALETLVKLGRVAVPALIEALNEDDPQIRSRAATALTRVAGSS